MEPPAGEQGILLGRLLFYTAFFFSGDPKDFHRLRERSIHILRSLNASQWLVSPLRLYHPDKTVWKTNLDEALSIAQSHADLWRIGMVYFAMGNYYMNSFAWDEAQAAFEQSITIARQIGDLFRVLFNLMLLGIMNSNRKEYLTAKQNWQEALGIAEKLGAISWMASMHNNLGGLNTRLGDYEAAEKHLQYSMTIHKQRGVVFNYYAARDSYGSLKYAMEDYGEAFRIYQECYELTSQLEDVYAPAFMQTQLGFAQLALGDVAAAQDYFRMSLARAIELNTEANIIFNLVGCAGWLINRGQSPRALEILRFTVQFPFEDKHEADEARWLDQLNAELPAEVIAAAQARVETFELDSLAREVLSELG